MKKAISFMLAILLIIFCAPAATFAAEPQSIITATGRDVPSDDFLEEYAFPEEYRDNAVQFLTDDGILLCGYVIGEGDKGVTLAHANGWMVKSWLPFAERLADAGCMVILWEFRNIEPSGFAPEADSRRWELDVLAAAQVLRERGASEIIAMGASDGGTATAIAAQDIPDLAGIGILSSPSDSIGDAVTAIGNIKDVPAFFAVSKDDSQGDFYPHVEALFNACPSTQKQFNVIDGFDHGTDMITPDVPGMGFASLPVDDAQIHKRQVLSDELLLFVSETFGMVADIPEVQPSQTNDIGNSEAPTNDVEPTPANVTDNNVTPVPGSSTTQSPVLTPREAKTNNFVILWIIISAVLVCGIILVLVSSLRRNRK